MNFVGKYKLSIPLAAGQLPVTVILRNYYDGTIHGSIQPETGGAEIAKDISVTGDTIRFSVQIESNSAVVSITLSADDSFAASVENASQTIHIAGCKEAILPEDDGTEKIAMKRKALILYSSITRNTERVAIWFQETFEHYGMEVTRIKVVNNMDWEQYAGQLYFEDYDVVCLGSPIIGGSPMKAMLKNFSAGAASNLEDNVAKNAAAGLGFNAQGAGGFQESEVKGGGAAPDAPKKKFTDPASKWSREPIMPYPGGPHYPGRYQPIGIAFTTYGGGFAGSDECLPTLSLLKLYLEDKGAKVIGEFACCGKEFGPAGLDDGVTPRQISIPPVYYRDADGNYHAGSFFFHCHANSKPGPREELRARAFIADIVEDHFYTADGKRRPLSSRYVSIS